MHSAFFCICKHTLTSLSSCLLSCHTNSYHLYADLFISVIFFFFILCTKSLKALQYRNPLLHGYSELIAQKNCTLRRVSVCDGAFSNSQLSGILFHIYVVLRLQLYDSPLWECYLLLTVVSKGLRDDSGSSTKIFAQFPFHVLWIFLIKNFKRQIKH